MLNWSFGYTQTMVNGDTGSKFSAIQANEFIAHHNMARKELNIAPLVWNSNIAGYAQEWAEFLANKKKCKLIHRDELNKNPLDLGENLYWFSSSDNFNVVQASVGWYDEKSFYKHQPLSYKMVDQAGHYTQMIWSGTTEMGAGKAICPSGAVIIVANYNPMGNTIGQFVY
jgi:pathogenesis-related protein 1